MAEIFGIDVAKYQNVIDWTKVKKDFAILKVTQKDNSVEPTFERNYRGASANNIPIGVYKYVYAKNVTEAKAEAQGLLKILNGRKMGYGVWLDMEDSSIRSLGKQKLSEIILAEAEIIYKAGYGVGIYCNRDWYYNALDSYNLKKRFPFWIARYPKPDYGTYNANSSLNPKSYGIMWQYSSKGKVNGINANVDLNVLYAPISTAFSVNKNITINKETTNPYTVPTRTLRKGSKGNDVKWLQYELKKRGYDIGKAGVDGDFGNSTYNAVVKFQRDNKLVVDGIVGAKTIAKLK
jgi:GH25 family lysozyme M1 (1,4-beta-N-acetylmuramidase)